MCSSIALITALENIGMPKATRFYVYGSAYSTAECFIFYTQRQEHDPGKRGLCG